MSYLKRHVATITFYCYGKDANEAFNEAKSIRDSINRNFDSTASIEAFHEQPFGSLESTKIDISKLKNQ